MSASHLFRKCLRSEFAHQSHALLDCRTSLIRHGAFLPYRRCQHATPFSTLSGHRNLYLEADPPSQQISNFATDEPSPSQRQEKTQNPTDATRQSKRNANTAKSPARVGSKSTQKRSPGSSRTKKPSGTDQAAQAKPMKKKKPEKWQIQKAALKEKFQDGWNPPKKLSPDALDGIRHLHSIAPDKFTTPVLAEQFEVSPEAIRRILKSKWRPSEAEMERRRERWEKRHDRIWSHLAQLGLRPKTKRTAPYDDVAILYEKPGGAKKQ